jgi:O-antigen/teichoic acid export membrane protein
MAISVKFLLRGIFWSFGSFGVDQALRLVTNIILARLLAPDVFGIMLIVNSVRVGIELISDIGLGQNIVYQDTDDPDFYDTAWTLQTIRGALIWLVICIVALPVSLFYHAPILGILLPIVGLTSLIGGFSSISTTLLQKRMQIARLNTFEILTASLGSSALLIFAYFTPTIWAIVFGIMFTSIIGTAGTYFLIPNLKHRFVISKKYLGEILHFGKWIFVSSLVFFLSTNFDRLYLAKIVTLEVVGVYGIARSLSEALGQMVQRFGAHVLFPFIASHSDLPRAELRAQLRRVRGRSLAVAAFGFSIIAATADLPIRILYDQRYQAASWMLPVLIIGSWFSVLTYINEATLLGLGRPAYVAGANSAKFIFLLVGLPLGISIFGLFGGVLVVVMSELFRYLPVLVGQRREQFSFGMQDFFLTVAVFLLMTVWEVVRWRAGYGNSFETLPTEVVQLFVSFLR